MNNGSRFVLLVKEIISIVAFFVWWNFHAESSKQDP